MFAKFQGKGETTMLRSILNRSAARVLWGAVIFGGITAPVAPPAQAQARLSRQIVLSPGAQRALRDLGSGLPPYGQLLVVRAVRMLGQERAETELSQLAQLDAMAPGLLRAMGPVVIVQSLQHVPAQYHQAFVNGLLGVTPAEEQYANQMLSMLFVLPSSPSRVYSDPYSDPVRPRAPWTFPPATQAGNPATDDPITQGDVWKLGRDMTRRNYDTWRNRPN